MGKKYKSEMVYYYCWQIAAISSSIWLTIFFVGDVEQWIKTSLIIVILIFGFLGTGKITFDKQLMRMVRWIKFRNPEIGILYEEKVVSQYSDFGPEDWKKQINKIALTDGLCIELPFRKCELKINPYGWETKEIDELITEKIGVKQSFRKYEVIINPYGEAYPEESSLSLKTMSKIKEYVYNGGIFVSIGGYPFFYAANLKNPDNTVEIAVYSRGLEGTVIGETVSLKYTTHFNSQSLIEGTILSTLFNFSLITNETNSPEKVTLFQTEDDKLFFKDLLGDNRVDVYQFRSFVGPMSGALPIVRAKTKGLPHKKAEYYPLVALPYGRGFFVLGGIGLRTRFVPYIIRDTDKNEVNPEIINSSFILSCQAVCNIVAQIKLNKIKFHEESVKE